MRRRGFTLVEVLVALVIVAAGASAVLASLNSAATSTTYLRDKTFAGWIASNRLVETRLAATAPPDGNSEGEVDYAGRRWQWRQQVMAGELPGLRRIDVSVRPAREAPALEGADDWTLTISGVLGRDVATAGAGLEWEPVAAVPGDANVDPAPAATDAPEGVADDRDPDAAVPPDRGMPPRPAQGPRT